MIDYLKLMYKSYPEMIIKTHLVVTNSTEYVPSPALLDQVRNHFVDTLAQLNLETEDLTFKGLFNPNPERYQDLISEGALVNCKGDTIDTLMDFVENNLRPKLSGTTNDSLIRSEEIPFMMGQDRYTHMIFLTFYDLLILDWDVKDGVPKDAVVPMLERFINGQALLPENKRLFLAAPCFKIYETDNGVHAYLISHRVPYDSQQSSEIMLSLCADYYYAAFARIRAYSSRLTPKVYDKDSDRLYDEADIKRQFIQRPGVDGTIYVGDGIVDPALEAIVDVIYKLQTYVKTQSSGRIINHEMHDDIIDVAKFLYRTMRPKYVVNNRKWIFEISN
jgi:hypothetical protein